MTEAQSWLLRAVQQEDVFFLLTNRIPRRAVTQLVGWFSKIEQPLIRDLSLRVWQYFADLELEDAETREFRSMHDCFTRRLRPGARAVDPDPRVLTSPCDAIVGACGPIAGTNVVQAKGFPYTLFDLLNDAELVARYRSGCYATLRLSSSMYHRFHAPHDCTIGRVTYISGDTWNTNPIALKRVQKLFCKNERAVIEATLQRGGHPVVMVAVAAILVASIRLQFADVLLHLKYAGPNRIPCSARAEKGQELGWFEHGSTIIVFAPEGFRLCEAIEPGRRVYMGQRLMHLP